MSANSPPAVCGTSTEIVFRGVADLRGQEYPISASAEGGDADVHLYSLMGTPVPKGLSSSSDNVIVERTPNLVRKVTVLKQLPERQPVPSRERSVVVKSTKLLPGSYSGSCLVNSSGNTTGSNKPAKDVSLKTDKENLPKEKEEFSVTKSKELADDDIFKLMGKEETDIDGGEEKNVSEQSESRAKKEYVRLQIQKRKQQRMQDLIKKREQEETKLKNLKDLKDKQIKLVQNNVRRARQRQQQQQQQEQETAQVTGSEDQCQQWTNEEIMSKMKETADVNITLKNMVAAMQKEQKGFGHQKSKDREIPRHMTNVTVRNKDTMISPELSVPNLGSFVGKLDQLKNLGHQNESDIDIPLNDGTTEALSTHFGLEPMVPSFKREDAEFPCYSSVQTYNLKKRSPYGVRKGVTETLKEYFEASKRKHVAATKIQAAFRGYQIRKMIKKDNKVLLKNKNHINTENVDELQTKCLPATSAEPEIGSASLIHEKVRSRVPQKLDILVKKEVTKILKDMHLKVSIDSNSKLDCPAVLQPKIPVALKEHVKPKGNVIKKNDIMVRKEVTKTLKEFMEIRKKQELAATKIQAAFRGYWARKLHNTATKRADKYTFCKGLIPEAKDTVPPNRQFINVRSDKSNNDNGYLNTAELSSSFPSTQTVAESLSEWLKPMYIEPCPYNVMTAIQNTMLSRSGPSQPYWIQANREHVTEQSKAAQTGVRCESGQVLPVIDASKEKTRRQLAVHQFIHRQCEPYLATDNESMQCEDGLSVNSSALEAEHSSSSDESRTRWKKCLSVTSSQEVLPSRVKPVQCSISDSEIIIRPSFSSKLQKNFEKINLERNMGPFPSVGRPAVMPKKVKYRHYGLVPPDVELKRKKKRILVGPADSSCQAESSGSDTWDSHRVQHQRVDQSLHASGIVRKAYKKGLTSRETGEFRYTDKKQDGRLNHIRQLGDKQKENLKGFQDKVRSDVKDTHEEKMNTQMREATRPPATGGKSIADIIEAGRMLHPTALHLQFQAEMNRLDSVEESSQRLTEIEAILSQNMQAKKETKRMQQAHCEVKTSREDKQVQAELIIQTARSHVQTQMPDRAHQLVQSMPYDQIKFSQQKVIESFLETDSEQDKQVPVVSSPPTQTPNNHELEPLSEPHILMPLVSNSHPEFRPIHSVLSSQIGTIPTHRHVSEAVHIANHAKSVSKEKTSGAILEPEPSHVSVTQLVQEAEHTRRMVTLDSDVLREAMSRRREDLMSKLSEKCEQWDIKHKEFMRRIEKEDNEQLNRILLRKFTVSSSQPFVDVPASQFHQQTKEAEDVIQIADSKQLTSCALVAAEQQDSSAGAPLLQTQQMLENVNYKHGSDIVAEALSSIGKEVTDLERTVADNLVDSTPEQSFQTISEGISERDDSVVSSMNKEVQDLNISQTSSFSDVFFNEADNMEKVSRIRESLHKIDKLIYEEKETSQKHVDLLNEKFRLVKERTKAEIKLLQAEIWEHRGKGEEHLVPGLKKKQFSLLHTLEQARQDSKREYDKLLKATVRRKLALRQQKAIIKSYLKSVQLGRRAFQEGHRSTCELKGGSLERSSANAAEEEPVPSTDEDILGPVPKSESLEFSVTGPLQIPATDEQVFSAIESNTTAVDISLKQICSHSEEKSNAFEELTDSVPQTEAVTELSDLERRVRGLREQLHKKKSEAEKLRQEQQRKKKEQLRIKEQSLLKQIHAYDAYIDEIKKELEGKMDYSTDTSLPPEKLWIHDSSEHDGQSAGVSSAQSSGNKLLKQKQEKHDEKKWRISECGLVSGSCSQPVVTNMLKDVDVHEFEVSVGDTNENTQLRAHLQAHTDECHVLDCSSLETALHSHVSSSVDDDDLKDEKGSEQLEKHSEIVSVIEEVQEVEEERDTELNSTVCDHNSGNSVQESLCVMTESESLIQELIISKQCKSVQRTESAEEVESVLEEVSWCVTEIEENRDHSNSLEQDLQDSEQQSDALLNHSEERVISSVLSSLKDSVQLESHSVHKYGESGIQEGILGIEEEIPGSVEETENIPEIEEETADSDEDNQKTEECNRLNVVSEISEMFCHKDFLQESDHTCDVNEVKEKADEEISGKVERITDIIFQQILNESLKTVCKKDTKCHKSAFKILSGNECKSQIVEETGTEVDMSNQMLITTDSCVKQNEDKNLDRVDNITNAILEQLLVESSAIFYSKKSKTDGSGKIHENLGRNYEEVTDTRGEAVAGTPTHTLGLPNRNGINIRKRVSEILAESSGCLSTTKEKSRPQDFMITTYDVLSPEEMSQPGSLSKEELDGTVNGVTENLTAQHKVELEIASGGLEGPDTEWFDEDYGLSQTRREAEELRLQQLQIEQEIQELEQAQEQVSYFYIREIPNKPPPPYTPPGQTVRSPAAPCKLDLTSEQESHFIPFTAEELSSLTVTAASYLHDVQAMGGDVDHAEVPSGFYDDNDTDIKSTSRRIFKKLVFDLTKDIIKDAYGWVREKPCAPWDWPAFTNKRNKPVPRSREMLQEVVLKQVLGLFGFASKARKEKLLVRWSRKKRDYVDEILMKESHEEESAWTNYDEDEVTVKNEITLGILDSLLDETVQIISGIRRRKQNKS